MKTIALLALTVSLLGIMALGVPRFRENSRTNRIRSALRVPGEPQDVFSPEMVEGLPPVAQRYLLHAIKSGTPLARWVEIEMRGEIRPTGGWMPFEAEQVLMPGRGFIWMARASFQKFKKLLDI